MDPDRAYTGHRAPLAPSYMVPQHCITTPTRAGTHLVLGCMKNVLRRVSAFVVHSLDRSGRCLAPRDNDRMERLSSCS
jgi:hypothetical protein